MTFGNVLVFLFAFLLGAIPFSVIVGKLFFKTDVRKQGSGNPGATNTLRVLGAKAGLAVLLLDIAKGLIAILMAKYFVPWPRISQTDGMAIAGALAIAGHVFSPFLGFKGGKGVATTFGVIIALEPWFALIMTAVFFVTLFLSRYVSLASIVSVFVFTVLTLLLRNEQYSKLLFSISVTLLIIIKHKANILRLMKGEENKFVFSKRTNNQMHKYKIWLSPPHLNGHELQYIKEALDQNWISPYGENVDAFEDQLQKHFGAYVALVNSGTSAIHLSLILNGIRPGDEVILPTLNFAGCVNPVLYLGARPAFIDSERDTFNMDPALVDELIVERTKAGKKPKAIIAVDLFGIPCKIKELEAIAAKYGIPLIEDAADAIGASVDGKPLGSFGKMGIISFNGNKVITTSGGGALICEDKNLIEKAKYLANQAREIKPYYLHREVGYNYMMSNILAGIGRGQFCALEDRLRRRREIYATYKSELKGIVSMEFVSDLPGNSSNRWLSVALVHPNYKQASRDDIYYHLEKNGIESRPVWNPMHLQPAYQGHTYHGTNVAESIFKSGICLPSGSSMTDNELQFVIDKIKELF